MLTLPTTPLLTINEVAALCQVSPRTVFRWLAAGRLPAIRVGNVTRIRREDLARFLTAHEVGGPACPADPPGAPA